MATEDRSILTRASNAAPVTVAYGEHPGAGRRRFGRRTGRPTGRCSPRRLLAEQYRPFTLPWSGASVLMLLACTTVLLEYRRLGGGGGWPDTFDDVRVGLARSFSITRELLGESWLDTARVGISPCGLQPPSRSCGGRRDRLGPDRRPHRRWPVPWELRRRPKTRCTTSWAGHQKIDPTIRPG